MRFVHVQDHHPADRHGPALVVPPPGVAQQTDAATSAAVPVHGRPPPVLILPHGPGPWRGQLATLDRRPAVARNTLVSRISERDNGIQPVKRKRAPEASNSPGIVGRVCDEWPRGGRNAAPYPHDSEHSPMPQRTQASNGGGSVRCVTLLSNSGRTITRSLP